MSKEVEKVEEVEKAEKKDENRYPDYIMEAVRQRLGLDDEHDTSKDAEINAMSSDEVFDHVVNWEGLINYTYTIKDWVYRIYGIDLDIDVRIG